MTKTIHALSVVTSAAVGDEVPIWRVANGDTKRITKANFIGATITGGGTLALGGFTLTVGANSTVNGSLVGDITGGGTLATGGFTLTVPATGVASILSLAQTFTALKTFSAGINLGGNTLQNYVQGTFTPTVGASGSTPTVTYTTQVGNYTRIGNVVFFNFSITVATISGGTSSARIGSFPIAASAVVQPISALVVQTVDVPGTVTVGVTFQMVTSGSAGALIASQDNAAAPSWPISSIVAGSSIAGGGFYFV